MNSFFFYCQYDSSMLVLYTMQAYKQKCKSPGGFWPSLKTVIMRGAASAGKVVRRWAAREKISPLSRDPLSVTQSHTDRLCGRTCRWHIKYVIRLQQRN